MTLHYTQLHYSAPQIQIQLQNTTSTTELHTLQVKIPLQYTTLHSIELRYTTLAVTKYNWKLQQQLHSTRLQSTTLHSMTLRHTMAYNTNYKYKYTTLDHTIPANTTNKTHNFNHLWVHQWIPPYIRDSQQPSSPITKGVLFRNSPPPCAVPLVNIHMSHNYVNQITICTGKLHIFAWATASSSQTVNDYQKLLTMIH